MMVSVPTNTLHELADGVFVWLQPGGESGVSNAGVIVADARISAGDPGVAFAGGLSCFAVRPAAFERNPPTWADVLDGVRELADTIVRGQGPVGGEEETKELQGYLRHCVAVARREAPAIAPGPWDN